MARYESQIAGVMIQPLKEIVDGRGAVLHMLRSDSPLFKQFGEIYFSLIVPGAIKAWKRHIRMTQHFAVPLGLIRLVFYDDRQSGQERTEEFLLGRPGHYCLVRIPPLLWYGFQGIGDSLALVANCADLPHDPGEAESMPPDSPYFPYSWGELHG